MKTYHVIVSGIRLSDGKPYKLETTCEAHSVKEAESHIMDYDWDDAATMLINIWPVESVGV